MFNDLAASRAARTGDVTTEGVQYPGGAPSSPTIQMPRESEFYERRGAALSKRGGLPGIRTSGLTSEMDTPRGVTIAPEPREPLEGERPGSQWSVKRTSKPVERQAH